MVDSPAPSVIDAVEPPCCAPRRGPPHPRVPV